MSQLAFIGLGIMGAPMAGHLLAAGNSLAVNNRTKSKSDALLAKGAKWAATPADAAKDAEILFVCVTDTPDVEKVLFGPAGASESIRPGTIVVDHSTISPAATKDFAARLSQKGASLIDAPVSGGDVGARNATLAIMAGGEQKAFDRVLPLLKLMGKTITRCGPTGAGQLTKLVNQILVSVTNLATCEALSFAQSNGLDLAKTIQATAGGAAGSWQLQNLGPKMAAGDFAPGFMIDLQQKDLRLVLEAAAQSHQSLPATSLVNQLFTAAQAHGRGKDGTQALFTVLQNLARGRQ